MPGGGEEAAYQAAAAAMAPRQGALSPRAHRSITLQVPESTAEPSLVFCKKRPYQ